MGTARVRGDELRLNRTAELAPGCYGSDVYTYETVMARPLTWTIEDGRLTLANSKGTLVYRERDSIYPHQSARTVLAGEKHGWQYRVAVERRTPGRHTTRGWFEYRRGPGHSWSFNPLYTTASPEQTAFRHPPGPPVVAGFAPLRAVHVEYIAAKGATAIRLPVTTIAPKQRWKAFAGEVPSSSRTSTIKAIDANGRTIMTCTVTYSGTDRDDFGCSL